jgi:hypothetical protein
MRDNLKWKLGLRIT